MFTLPSDLFFRSNRLNAMANTIEDGREDSFSLLEDSNVEKTAIVADSDNETVACTLLDIAVLNYRQFFTEIYSNVTT